MIFKEMYTDSLAKSWIAENKSLLTHEKIEFDYQLLTNFRQVGYQFPYRHLGMGAIQILDPKGER